MKLPSIIFAALFASAPTLAEVHPGTWKGIISPHANCFMDVLSTRFEGNNPNPLNKRLSIKIGAHDYVMSHPTIIDLENGHVLVDETQYRGVIPTAYGAFAAVLNVTRATSDEEIPQQLSVMEEDWRTGASEVIQCASFKLVWSE